MAAPTAESTPLLQSHKQQDPTPRPQRNVTFNPTVSSLPSAPPGSPSRPLNTPVSPSQSHERQGKPMLSALKLRRRHSHGAPLVQSLPAVPKPGAQRTTKHAQKLKLLPNPGQGEDGPDEESGRDVYSQFTRIKDPMARRDAARLGKDDRKRLPRVTAYSTANAYKLDDLMKFLRGRGRARGAAPKLFDECIYTPYRYPKENKPRAMNLGSRGESQYVNDGIERRHADSEIEIEENTNNRREEPIDIRSGPGPGSVDGGDEAASSPASEETEQAGDVVPTNPEFDTQVHTPEVFLFDYGTVVVWGMTEKEEERFLNDISKFEKEKLSEDDVQVENFNFYYTSDYQARIYNDFISLREKRNYMTKLAISHALSQSVKTSLYEDLVDNTIDTTKEIPTQLATSGKTGMTRRQIAMQIGELFVLRISIHLQGSVLDSPELMWAEPGLEPVYAAVRSYLELDARCSLLTERLDVIADLLAVLKDQSSHRHGEFLEWIVIVLIAAEIFVAAINIVVDLYAGVE